MLVTPATAEVLLARTRVSARNHNPQRCHAAFAKLSKKFKMVIPIPAEYDDTDTYTDTYISMLDVIPITALTFDECENPMTFYYSANP